MHISQFTQFNVVKKRSERSEIIEQIYAIYTSGDQKQFRRLDNWKRYCEWCRENKIGGSAKAVVQFRKSKRFIKEMPIKTFCFFLSHIPTKDLYYVLSVGKDMQNRNQNFSKYLIGSIVKPNPGYKKL